MPDSSPTSEPTPGHQIDRLRLLLEHHRDSFGYLRDYLRRRDRLFVYSLAAAAALLLRSADAAGSERLMKTALDRLVGPGAEVDAGALAVLLWFVFFSVVARYFQAAIHLNRQYDYLAQVEKEIAGLDGSKVFSRESTAYLRSYPKFSNWMHWLYVWFFPGAIVVATVWSLVIEVHRGPSIAGFLSAALGLALVVTVGLYLYSSHCDNAVDDDPSPR
jgi:hypothetical protein